jgi:transglutaminase-like putative cysteine protease
MKFEVSAKLKYEVLAPSTIILSVQAYKYGGQLVTEESFSSDPDLKTLEWIADRGEKVFKVLDIPDKGLITLQYKAMVENGCKRILAKTLDEVPVSLMPANVLPYLNPSRYCQSDKLYKFASTNFGKINNPYRQVIAIRDWVYNNVEYKKGYTNSNTSAHDTLTEHVGVCRDFAHLGIALCRALTIPARYLTAYAYKLKPQDFHACFEVYLGGMWIIVDATKLVPVNGLVKIATAMDAADAALASIFGNLKYLKMEVQTTFLDGEFVDATIDDQFAYSYQ